MKKMANLIGHLIRRNIISRALSLLLTVLIIFYAVPSVIYAEAIEAISNLSNKNETTSNEAAFANNNASMYADSSRSNSFIGQLYEVTYLREESAKHFHLPDGSYVAAQYQTPVHYLDSNGNYLDIDNSLSENNTDEFTNKSARIKFAKKITGNETLFTLQDGNTKLSLSLDCANRGVVGEVTNSQDSDELTELQKMMNLENLSSSVLYRDILDGTDLEYIAQSKDIKENIIVKERRNSYVYIFELKLNGLVAALTDNGDIHITNEDTGELAYLIPAPVVFDANDNYAPFDAAFYTLIGNNKKYTLTVTVSADWMNSDDISFPVTIDPAIMNPNTGVIDTSISSTAPDASFADDTTLPILNTRHAYWKTSDLPSLPNTAYIKKAVITMRSNLSNGAFVGAYNVLTDWNENLTYNQYISTSSLNGQLGDLIDYNAIVSGFYDWNITTLVQNWYNDPSTNFGVAFKWIDANGKTPALAFMSSEHTAENFRPALTVYYQSMRGLEDYWTYSSHSAGLAGSGSINLATGELIFTIPTLSTTDSLFGFTPILVYDSTRAGESYVYPYAETGNTSNFMPKGFKLNMTETLLKKSFVIDSYTICPYYVYADADGTEHGFYYTGDEGIYLDEDGLGMVLTEENDGTVTIKTNSHIKRTFSKNNLLTPEGEVHGGWYLTEITDKLGNKLIYTFGEDMRPAKVSVKPYNSAQIDFLEFSYHMGALTMIYNPASKDAVVFRYSSSYSGNISNTASTYLKQVDYAHGNDSVTALNWSEFYNDGKNTTNITVLASANYAYNDKRQLTSVTDNISGQKILYGVSTNQCTAVRQFAGSTLGKSLEYAYYTGYTDIKSWGSDDDIYTDDDVYTRYTFDEFGRSTSAYSYANLGTEIYGATLGKYSELKNSKNNIEHQIVLSGIAVNYLLNGDFDEYSSTDGFKYWTEIGDVTKEEKQSVAVLTSNENSSAAISQDLFLKAGDYNLNVLTKDKTSYSVHIHSTTDSGTSYISTLNKIVDSINFTVQNYENGGDRIKITIYADSSNELSLDKISLINALGSYNFSYTDYGNFDLCPLDSSGSVIPAGNLWKTETGSNCNVEVENKSFGDSVKVTANLTKEKYVKQTVYRISDEELELYGTNDFDSNVGAKYILGGFGKAENAIYSADAGFGLRAEVIYYVGSNMPDAKEIYDFKFNPNCSGWQYICGSFNTAVSNYTCIKEINIYCDYSYQPEGVAYFDNIFLINSTETDEVKYEYYDNGLIKSKESYSFKEWYKYDEANNLSVYINSNGELIIYHYNPTLCVLVNTVEYSFTYNAGDDPLATFEDKTLSKTPKMMTVYNYDPYRLCTEIKSYPLDENGAQAQDAKMLVERYTYNTSAGSKIFGSIATHINTSEIGTSYFYDNKSGRLIAEINSKSGEGVCYSYDIIGNLVSVTPALITDTGYSKVADAENVNYTYNERNLLDSIETASTTYSFTYDVFGNKTSATVGTNKIASYIYNNHNGKLKKIIYGNGLAVEYVYNSLDLVSEIWYTDNASKTKAYEYQYTADGLLYKFIDNISEETTVYHYNINRQLISKHSGNASSSVNIDYAYDDIGLLKTEKYQFSTFRYSVFDKYSDSISYNYEFSSDKKLTATIIEKGITNGKVNYSYDEYDRLEGISFNFIDYVNYTHNIFTKKNDFSYEVDSTKTLNRISSYSSHIEAANQRTSLKVYIPTYDDSGNITSLKVLDKKLGIYQDLRYYYDDRNQLIREDNSILNKTFVYEYDNAGNILKSFEYALTEASVTPTNPTKTDFYSYAMADWGDVLTGYNGVPFAYDKIGNPTSYYNGNNYRFVWTGRLLEAIIIQNVGAFSLTYDDNGLRQSKTALTQNNLTTYYHYDGTRLFAEENSIGEFILYIYDGAGTVIGMQYRNHTYEEDVWDVYWYDKNLQGDIVGVYNSQGTLLVSYAYDAWGNFVTTYHNGGENTTATRNPFTYRGYYYDRETGLYYVSSRYYDPEIGRWISPEPNVYAGAFDSGSGLIGYNVYAYCANNPVNFSDPTGEFILTALIVGVVAGAVIGGAIGGTVAYNSAKSSGLEGSDLFWATAGGVGKGALIGGVAGGLVGATGGVVAAYGATSVAGTAMITATATITAKATEVTALQAKKSTNDGDNGWQIANDCIDSVFSNGGKIISPALTKAGTTSATYVATDLIKHKVVPLGFNTFLHSTGGKVLPYGFAAYAWGHTAYSIFCTDPIARANQRGYGLR